MASLLLTQRKFARVETFFKMTSYVAIYITISFCLSLGYDYDVLHYGITKGFSKSKAKDLYHKGKCLNRTPPLVAEIYHCIFCMSNRRQTHHSRCPVFGRVSRGGHELDEIQMNTQTHSVSHLSQQYLLGWRFKTERRTKDEISLFVHFPFPFLSSVFSEVSCVCIRNLL